MSFKWTSATHESGNIIDVDSFNRRYEDLKGSLNGGIDRDQLPANSIGRTCFLDNCFYKSVVQQVSLQTEYRREDGVENNFPGVFYQDYAGGWKRCTSVEMDTQEGMLKLELSMFARIVQTDQAASGAILQDVTWSGIADMIRYLGVRILINGQPIVGDLFKVWGDWNAIYLVGDAPVSDGKQTIEVQWQARPPGTGTWVSSLGSETTKDRVNRCTVYFDGGTLLLLNRYR
jgi:hypothetical protein